LEGNFGVSPSAGLCPPKAANFGVMAPNPGRPPKPDDASPHVLPAARSPSGAAARSSGGSVTTSEPESVRAGIVPPLRGWRRWPGVGHAEWGAAGAPREGAPEEKSDWDAGACLEGASAGSRKDSSGGGPVAIGFGAAEEVPSASCEAAGSDPGGAVGSESAGGPAPDPSAIRVGLSSATFVAKAHRNA
jgi:hypothetical protein